MTPSMADMNKFSFFRFAAFLIALGVRLCHAADVCTGNPCQTVNHRCKVLSDSEYQCLCRPGCSGPYCTDCVDFVDTEQTSACLPNPCQSDCQCIESCKHAAGYYCRSDSGYLGKNCSIPVPTLRCEPDRMIFAVSESFVDEYDMGLRNSYISVAPSVHQLSTSVCQLLAPSNGMYEMTIPLPFSACNTTSVETPDGIVFTNQMWFNRRIVNALFDMPIPAVEFRCIYDRVYRVVTSLQPVVSTPSRVVTSKKDIVPTISLCKVPSCPGGCAERFRVSGGATYTVGEIIHVTMSLDSGNLTTGVAEMFLSCSREFGSPRMLTIVNDGCGSSTGLPSKIGSSFVSDTVCVSFQTPRGLDCTEFFIHAELQSCRKFNTESCSQTDDTKHCRSSRGKRSAPSVIVVGPLVVLNGSTGKPVININGMEDYVSEMWREDLLQNLSHSKDSNDEVSPGGATDIAWIVVFCVSAAVMLLMLIPFAYVQYHRKK